MTLMHKNLNLTLMYRNLNLTLVYRNLNLTVICSRHNGNAVLKGFTRLQYNPCSTAIMIGDPNSISIVPSVFVLLLVTGVYGPKRSR